MPGVYISYPVLRTECSFCNFASGVFSRELEPRYGSAAPRDSTHEWEWTPDTVYLGGGTPSNMDLGRARARARASRDTLAEATIEAAPGTITREKAELGGDSGSIALVWACSPSSGGSWRGPAAGIRPRSSRRIATCAAPASRTSIST